MFDSLKLWLLQVIAVPRILSVILLTTVMPASYFWGCEMQNFDQAINHRPSSESNWSS